MMRPQRKTAERARQLIAEDAKRQQNKIFLDIKTIKTEELKHYWQTSYSDMVNGMKNARVRESFLKMHPRDAPIVNKQVFIDILIDRLPQRFCRYDPTKFDDDEDAEDEDYTVGGVDGGGGDDDDEDEDEEEDEDDEDEEDDDDEEDEPEELPDGENKRDAGGYERDGFVISDEDANKEENAQARKEMDVILGKMNEETEKRRAERMRMVAEMGEIDDGEDGEDIWSNVQRHNNNSNNERAKKRQRRWLINYMNICCIAVGTK